MLRELEEVLNRHGQLDEEQFQRAAARVLTRQFVYRNRHGDREAYLLVNDHRNYFRDLFEALGFDLVFDDSRNFLGILPLFRTRSLSLEETNLLLVLRHVYEDEIISCRAESDEVTIDWQMLLERYRHLTGRSLKDTRAHFLSALKPIERYGVIRAEETQGDADLPTITILPGITALVSRETLRTLRAQAATAGADGDTSGAIAPDTEFEGPAESVPADRPEASRDWDDGENGHH